MIGKVFFIVLVTICVSITLTNGQECVPRGVLNLTLLPNGTLSWTVSPQESCEITHFHINIHRNGQEDFDVDVEETSTDVSFLPFCESWVFTVKAVALNTPSLGHILIARIPLPSDADIALGHLDVVEIDGELNLIWELEDDNFKSCADSYRVTISNDQSADFTDLYVTEKSLRLYFVSPCIIYEFGVRVINNGRPAEGPLKTIEYNVAPARQNPPRLTAASLGPTMANMTWTLDSLSENRCPIRSLYVDGGQYFNISIPVKDPTERDSVEVNLRSLRPNSLYVLKVSVENSAGVSNHSIVGVQTLELEPGAL